MAGRWFRAGVLLLVVLAAAPLAACDDDDDGSGASPPAGETARAVAGQQAPPDADGDGVPDSSDACPGEREDGQWSQGDDGCPDGLDDLVRLARADISDFWSRTLGELGVSYVPPRAVTAYDGPIPTACGEAAPDNAFYCGASHSIYFHRAFLERQLQETGDFGPVFVLAHEWGHLVQAQLGLLQSQYSIQTELQADCFAGAYAKDAESRDILEQGDLEEAAKSLIEAGDPDDVPWFHPAAHGTPQQRLDAFHTGFEGGVRACLS